MSAEAAPTRALYHEQPSLQFRAQVVAVQGQDVALEATAFYPEGGGQNGDVGQLGWNQETAEVLETRKDKGSGVIWHRLAGTPPSPGCTVWGAVDADIRWRHMQRHSGEHLLAQAFSRVNPVFQVASVNMSGPQCTLDLLGDPAESHVRAAEDLLRVTLARTDLLLETRIVPEERLGEFPLRREPKVRGQVRLVMFRGPDGDYFDVSACGGTHVPRASLCAPVVVLRTERIKGGLTRVVFMAGEEAGAYLTGVYRQAKAMAQGFSVPVERLPERVDALRAERDGLAHDLAGLRDRLALALLRAQPLQTSGPHRVSLLPLDDPALLLPALSQVGPAALLAVVTPAGRCGVASRVDGVNAAGVLRAALTITGGKGGGRPDLAQGQTNDPGRFLAAVQEVLGSG